MIYNNILELIGRTPIVRINKLKNQKNNNDLMVKLEYFNPGGSIKDRIAFSMINGALEMGVLKKGGTIIEPTSGNTGIGIAMVSAALGFKAILVMPENMSKERIKILELFGAEMVLTPKEKGMAGAIEKAKELKEKIENSIILSQFTNHLNPEIHRKTTAVEIINDLESENIKLDYLVVGVGTGGSITGVGEVLKKKYPNLKVIAVEPAESSVLSGGQKGPHGIQGIGAGFIPEILNLDIIDEIIKVKTEDAYDTAKLLPKEEGVFVGISSGAVFYAMKEIDKREINKAILGILADTGERYLSVL